MQKRAGANIAIGSLPKAIQPSLRTFDVDGDGNVILSDLARATELYKKAKTNMLGAPSFKERNNHMVRNGKIQYDPTRGVQAGPFTIYYHLRPIQFKNTREANDKLLNSLTEKYVAGEPVPKEEKNIVFDGGLWTTSVIVMNGADVWTTRPFASKSIFTSVVSLRRTRY